VLACGGALVKPTRFHVQTISADTVVGMLRVGLGKQPSIGNEEMGVLLQQGADEGVFQATEHEIVSNVLDLAGTKLDLPALAEPALFVPETMTVMKTARALPPHPSGGGVGCRRVRRGGGARQHDGRRRLHRGRVAARTG
jgi:hypothetical protein